MWRISVDEPLQTVSPLPKRFIASGSFRCEQLFQIIRSNRPTTIAQTLQLVQSRYPSYFDNHAIAHNSLSLHEASFENPRAIVYGDDARTILTYNGDSTQGGYERLEVMCYNDAQDTFEFRDIAFPGEARSPEDLWDIPENQRNQPFVISPVNGGHPDLNCTMCHGDPPRPNWDTYNLWPGICSDHFPNAHINYSVVEERCRAFYDNRQNNPRYAVLGDRPMGSAFRLGQHLTHLTGEHIA
ncbi:MAG: hypothetical protein MJK18_15835 [Bdellovibrionales bacterium]|nr:hypothetical protein [Bdellovibrionales bacterium]